MQRPLKQWHELPAFATCILRNLPQVGDPFFAALAVCAMVVRPWHIAASTHAESWQNPLDLETQFLHQWMLNCMDHSLETADF
jgi:hypothetical protein